MGSRAFSFLIFITRKSAGLGFLLFFHNRETSFSFIVIAQARLTRTSKEEGTVEAVAKEPREGTQL